MPTTWRDASEIVTGLVLDNRLSLTLVRPETFHPPYDDVIKRLKNGAVEPEDLIAECGLLPIQTAHEAVKTLNGTGELDWVKILETTYAKYEAGRKLEKFSKRLLLGEEVDWGIIKETAHKAQEGIGGDFVPLSEIKSAEMPFIASGWKVIDDHLGGLPEVGLIVVGGDPGIGKTTFATQLAVSFARQHKDKNVAIYSLEMILSEIALRIREVSKTTGIEDRILLNDFPVSAEDVITKSATIDNLGLVVVDFLDLMIQGENSESAYAQVYKTLSLGAKLLHCPIILLAQLVKANAGIPKPKHLRYTKMAEAMAWMILMLYDKSKDWSDADSDELPSLKDVAYIIAWKIRGGFRLHKDNCPGAIAVPFKGSKGWHPTQSKWFVLKKI